MSGKVGGGTVDKPEGKKRKKRPIHLKTVGKPFKVAIRIEHPLGLGNMDAVGLRYEIQTRDGEEKKTLDYGEFLLKQCAWALEQDRIAEAAREREANSMGSVKEEGW